jgi:hypothetical protein
MREWMAAVRQETEADWAQRLAGGFDPRIRTMAESLCRESGMDPYSVISLQSEIVQMHLRMNTATGIPFLLSPAPVWVIESSAPSARPAWWRLTDIAQSIVDVADRARHDTISSRLSLVPSIGEDKS